MAALVVSLVVVTICFKLPIHFDPAPKPWKPHWGTSGPITGTEQVALLVPTTHTISISSSATGETPKIPTPDVFIPPQEDVVSQSNDFLIRKSTAVPVLDHADVMPKIHGGLGAYYILINYPEEAINQGIEGKLTLTFTVNEDGRTSDIQVTHPLHTLLDSAAVQALRRTRFIPGQHLGKSARIRMRLPVRFELVSSLDSSHTKPSAPKKTSE